MTTRIRDPVGTGIAVLVGVAFGAALVAPILPGMPSGQRVILTPAELMLLGGIGAVFAVPVCIIVFYILVAAAET